jgi:hypothetical protein
MAKTTHAVSENDLTRRVVQQQRTIDELADTEYPGLILGRVGQAQKHRMLDTGNIYIPARNRLDDRVCKDIFDCQRTIGGITVGLDMDVDIAIAFRRNQRHITSIRDKPHGAMRSGSNSNPLIFRER